MTHSTAKISPPHALMREIKALELFALFTVFVDADDDDDDDDDDESFLWYGWPTKGVYALLPAGTIVRDSHHRKSPTPWTGFEPAQNLSSDFVEWSCAAVITTTPWHHKTSHYFGKHINNTLWINKREKLCLICRMNLDQKTRVLVENNRTT